MALGPSIPDPGSSASSQLATLMALTQAVRVMQTTLTALETGNSGLNSKIEAVNGNNKASVTSLATAVADINGHLSASYGVTLDVNGYATGFNLLSTGAGTGSFNIRADIMSLVIPGYSAQPVMTIQNVAGTPTLAFNGNIIADNSVANHAYSNGSLGNIKYSQANGTTTLTITTIGRGPLLVLAFVDGREIPTSTNTYLDVTVNGSLISTYTIPQVLTSGSWYSMTLAKPFTISPPAGTNNITITYRNEYSPGVSSGTTAAVELAVIELGA